MTTTFQSVGERLTALVDAALQASDSFFTDHMKVGTYMRESFDGFKQEYLITAKDSTGSDLQQELDRILAELDKQSILAGLSADVQSTTTWCRALYQDRSHWLGPMESHGASFTTSMQTLKQTIEAIPDATRNQNLLIADTNSLLHYPAIESWSFSDIDKFTIVLPATVLQELDSFENSNKNERVREKAKTLVKKFKEYRTRGNLRDGVSIVNNKILLRVLPLEPTFDSSVPWLKPESPDDRVIAYVISLVRAHPHCVVALVSRDFNLQNKADYAGLYVLEPPDPPPTLSKAL